MMKTFHNPFARLILTTLFLAISMTSCTTSDDSQEEEGTEGSILGRWALDKRGYTSNGITSPELDYENNQPGCALNDYFEFKENTVFETGYYDPSCAVTPSAGNWSKTANLITITHPSEDGIILELVSLSATEMKVRANLTGTDGVEPGLELYINYTMVKVE